MYVTKLILTNLGPVENAVIQPLFHEDGRPKPIILVGRNGSGKSLALSVIVDAMLESQKKLWEKIPELEHNQFLRLMTGRYIKSGSDYSLTEVSFGDKTIGFSQVEFVSSMKRKDFLLKYPGFAIDGTVLNEEDSDRDRFFKDFKAYGETKPELMKDIYLYFPYFRYESPSWLNDVVAPELDVKSHITGVSAHRTIQTGIVGEINRWLLDLVLDREIYEKQIVALPLEGADVKLNVHIPGKYIGPNATTVSLIQSILTEILSSKDSSIQNVRFGISKKGSRSIAVHAIRNGIDTQEVPGLSQMSSGELMILSLFCTIIRFFDIRNGRPPETLEEIRGVVLVDEIDLHLHIGLQKDLLPKIISMFPNVQFIISNHSPFFNMGMAEKNGDDLSIVDMPRGIPIDATSFSEFQTGYDAFIGVDQQYKLGYEKILKKLNGASRPLIITEGKTDWMHFKAALSVLKSEGLFESLDIDFLEYGEEIEMGDARLASMCKHFADVPQGRSTIFVFDRDNPQIIKDMAGDQASKHKKWSKDVASMCIPIPPHRTQYTNVSVEFLYTDDEIRTVDAKSGKRLFFDNEIEEYGLPKKRKDKLRILKQADQDEEFTKKIFDTQCERIKDENGVAVAHSKTVFATNILNKEEPFKEFSRDHFKEVFAVWENILSK
ncbi:AAA family ATPase [Dankookia sp. GCM10030260]|uniref:AAA family ATPase n=1 Tax=Dankookia sp. GCM10030260 TaxID=3273390 RepID=UPI00360FE80C